MSILKSLMTNKSRMPYNSKKSTGYGSSKGVKTVFTVKKQILSVFVAAVIIALQLVTAYSATVTCPFGDLSVNGVLSAEDARLALRFSVDLEYYTAAHVAIGDTNGDGVISSEDARNILRATVGLHSFEKSEAEVNEEDFSVFINRPDDYLFKWETPEAPEVNAEPGTFTFTYYGRGHGVGLSCYGALSLEDGGYTYDRILAHYYTGTELMTAEEYPELTYYEGEEINTYELVATIVLQEIYGIPDCARYEEALRAMTVCVFTNIKRYDFRVYDRWQVGSKGSNTFDNVPENLRAVVASVMGQYIVPEGSDKPIEAVYYSMAAGMTAASESIWGGTLSYLSSVPSPFDMSRPGFIAQKTYTIKEIEDRILAYDPEIVLEEDPAEWLSIIEHTGSIDEERGYVTKIKVGDKTLTGYNQFHIGIMKQSGTFMSSCFTITYIPPEA